MTIRVGESWTARNGHRRWVSMSLGDLLFGWGVWAVLVLPILFVWWLLLAELWMAAECAILLFTAILALAVVAGRGARFRDITLSPLRWGLWMVDVKGQQR